MGKKARKRNRQRSTGPVLVTWHGETYQVADKIGAMPVLRFAKVASSGVEADTMEAGVAMYDFLSSCLEPADWRRFEDHSTRICASAEEIMELVQLTYQALSGRPTRRPPVSSDGQSSTEVSSEAASSSPVMRVIDSIPASRPDLKLAVWESQSKTA